MCPKVFYRGVLKTKIKNPLKKNQKNKKTQNNIILLLLVIVNIEK